DEGIRMEPDRERMRTLEPAFRADVFEQMFPGRIDWTVTAGNSSQISDGACALLIASRERAEVLGLRPKARFVSFAVVGDDPSMMLTGPIPATRLALERAGRRLEDVDVVEINEAFASVVLAWKSELEVPGVWFDEHVNPNGGAIAMGHPLGATGGKLMTDLVWELDRREGRFGLQVMCEGGGMANATVLERLPGGGGWSSRRSRWLCSSRGSGSRRFAPPRGPDGPIGRRWRTSRISTCSWSAVSAGPSSGSRASESCRSPGTAASRWSSSAVRRPVSRARNP